MATYASKTNPFIEKARANSSPRDDLEAPAVIKTAPGMARLHSKTKIQDKNLLLSLDEASAGVGSNSHLESTVVLGLDTNNNNNNNCLTGACRSDTETLSNESNKLGNISQIDDERLADEITEACKSLVEMASRSILEDNDAANGDAESPAVDQGEEKGLQGYNTTNIETRKSQLENIASPLEKINGFGMHEPVEGEYDEEEDHEEGESTIGQLANGVKNTGRRLSSESDRRKHQHRELIKKLRLQLRDLERYAYEQGDLEQVPQSVLAEKQSVIIDTLKEKLSLNLDQETIANLRLDELKRQVDKEINELVDPIITKEHLLNQLKTQLTDLERYVSHLHETIDRTKKAVCVCQEHGCSAASSAKLDANCKQNHADKSSGEQQSNLIHNDALPRTAHLIRTLVAQIICSDLKVQSESQKQLDRMNEQTRLRKESQSSNEQDPTPLKKTPQFHDGATWTIHLDRVVLATDSLVNLFETRSNPKIRTQSDLPKTLFNFNESSSLVESVVRRQLVPAIRELLSYGLMDPSSFPRSASSYASFLLDPYYILSSLTCFPSLQKSNESVSTTEDKIHIWNIIADYYESRSGPNFKQSSVKTLSQSFNLTASMNGPMKITSKQALLIAVDDIIDRLSRCKPNGPESHFKAFVYVALNQGKLATWIRLIFRNKSVIKKYYHNFSFVSQQEKMDKFISVIEVLRNVTFNLNTDAETRDQFVSAF